uniref:Uncharacterized protein n=1 Tax=Romanomermis culicivorax TaxID=13658 RepID=A0A915JVE4_ROMCU
MDPDEIYRHAHLPRFGINKSLLALKYHYLAVMDNEDTDGQSTNQSFPYLLVTLLLDILRKEVSTTICHDSHKEFVMPGYGDVDPENRKKGFEEIIEKNVNKQYNIQRMLMSKKAISISLLPYSSSINLHTFIVSTASTARILFRNLSVAPCA